MDRPLQQSIAEKAGRGLEDTSNTRSNESLDPSRARLDSDESSKRAIASPTTADVGKVHRQFVVGGATNKLRHF